MMNCENYQLEAKGFPAPQKYEIEPFQAYLSFQILHPNPLPNPRMSSKGRGKAARRTAPTPQLASAPIAHNLEDKPRTEDVLREENRHRDFASMMLSEPVLKGLK